MRSFFACASVVSVALACGGTTPVTPGSDGGSDSPIATKPPLVHRATASACDSSRLPGTFNPSPAAGSPCKADADCASGMNGRCEANPIGVGQPFSNVCSYDQCKADADCGAGSVCDCRNQADFGANTCFHGDCHTDLDCPGSYCSPSATTLEPTCLTGIDPGSFGYFCHTRLDECTDDIDCTNPQAKCFFVPAAAHWQCVMTFCTG